MKRIFLFPLHLTGINPQEFPDVFSGAYVIAFVKASSGEEAIERLRTNLDERQFILNEDIKDVFLLEDSWDNYVQQEWPEYIHLLPREDDFIKTLDNGGAVFGPFGAYIKEE